MKFPLCVANKKQTASFRIVGSMLAIAPLWLILAAANTSAYAQASDNVSNASATTSTASSPADWTQFHRDNTQRWNPYETVLGVNNVGGLLLKWQNGLGDSLFLEPGPFFESSPAVVNGVVYYGSDNGTFYALNASTGALLWSYTTPQGNSVISSPAVMNGVVYFSSTNDGNLYALNASTGALLWSDPIADHFGSSPAVANGVVYICGNYYDIYAVNASTGAILWSRQIGSQLTSSPAVANGVVYVGGGYGGIVYALDANTGAQLWSFATGLSVYSSPAVANGVVYIGDFNGIVWALNASTGAELWSFATGGNNMFSSPAVANGVVYVAADNLNLYALNASTGAKLWSDNIGTEGGPSPAVANGVVYVSSADRNLYALNASTGAKLWNHAIGLNSSSPTVVNGVVYVRGEGPTVNGVDVYAYGLGSGADLFLRIQPTTTTVHQGDLLTFAFPVWNLGPDNADHEVLNTQVPEGTTLDYVRISGTPGLGSCTTPPYEGTGEIVCHENSAMAPNTTWTVRVVVKVTAPSGTVITESATTTEDTPDLNLANNTATVSMTVQ
jgi:outer membrane protein assembly factor BamB